MLVHNMYDVPHGVVALMRLFTSPLELHRAHAESLNCLLVFVITERLRQHVGWHVVCRHVAQVNGTRLHIFAQEVIAYINVLASLVVLWIACQCNAALIVGV